jgi:hypothetical protein
MAKHKYEPVTIRIDNQDIAWVFVAPQNMPGRPSVAFNRFEKPNGVVHVEGDLSIGSPELGTFDMELHLTITRGTPGLLHLGWDEYDLKAGKCFAIHPGYKIEQLWAFTQEDGKQLLS